MHDIGALFAILFLVVLTGCFVAAEFSLITVRWTRVDELVEQNVLGAKAVQAAIGNLNETIAVTQLGITLCSLGVGWLGEPALAHMVHPWLHALPLPWSVVVEHGVAIAIAFLVITYVHVVLGELAPKAIALQHAETVALVFATPLRAFSRVFRPLSSLMRKSGGLVVRLLQVPEPPPEQNVHSAEEIDRLVEQGEVAGVIPTDEASYVRNVFELSDKKVADIMIARDKVTLLSLIATEDDILEIARETAHTRMPVYDGDFDNIVGVVNTKDLFHIFSLRGLVILMDAMYPATFVDPELPVARLLARLRREHRQMAVVRNSAGRFEGIVTLEDILEEIVGEIEDEHD